MAERHAVRARAMTLTRLRRAVVRPPRPVGGPRDPGPPGDPAAARQHRRQRGAAVRSGRRGTGHRPCGRARRRKPRARRTPAGRGLQAAAGSNAAAMEQGLKPQWNLIEHPQVWLPLVLLGVFSGVSAFVSNHYRDKVHS